MLSEIITAPGSAQSELGCPADWSPDCMRPWLQDPDGDGTWTWSTTEIPAGSYEVKVTHDLSWDENYGAGGAPGGGNIAYTVPADGVRVTFSYVLSTHVLTVTTSRAGPVPDLDQQKAHWLERGILGLGPPRRGERVELPLARRPDRRVGRRRGGDPRRRVVPDDARSPTGSPTTCASSGRTWPRTTRSRLSRNAVRQVSDLLTGQLAVAAYDDLGRLVDATGVQIPGVLDDVYGDAYDRDLGVTWQGNTPKLAVWAPTAKDVDLLVRGVGATTDTRVEMRRDGDGVWSVTGAARLERCQLPVRGRRLRARRGRGRDQHGDRPVLAGAHDGLGPVRDRRPRRPVTASVRLELAPEAESRPTRGFDDLRAPRARLLDR